MSTDVPWLSDREQCLWRSWLRLNAELTMGLQRELQDEAGLSIQDFEVLVHLTDSAEGRIRVTDLARLLAWDRSRVSHHVTRMEGRGLVQRRGCTEDGRGAFVEITETGRTMIREAAPGHVRAVRRLFFDTLDEADVSRLESMVGKLLAAQTASGPVGR